MKACLMIQGTMSGAGKSLLAAGLCRVFRQDGLKVAPFKSQNMALNSYITREGLEMGRAQVMQAEAAGIEPSVRMNPILLKPTRDNASQVILHGKPLGNMPAKDYFAFKKTLIPEILKAYDSLQKENDVIVIEGAGSPAEINLKRDDIVNMGLANLVDAPVLLVGDIDRGGVFAQLYGTMALLEPAERERVKGLVVNKFRGDKSILEPGLVSLRELCHCPVAGVVPYLPLSLEDEDSLTERFDRKGQDGLIKVAVIRTPRISNFTDFDALEGMEGLSLFYVKSPGELKDVDMIILPGTKNTMGDLRFIRESGLETAILREKEKGTLILGICGGYQMLGESLSDPEGAEEGGEMRGLGLLPIKTVFTKDKTRTQVIGKVKELEGPFAPLSGKKLQGYEIHMGKSFVPGEGALRIQNTLTGEEGIDGICQGNVLGTYVHGFFDEQGIQEALGEILLKHRGIEGKIAGRDHAAFKESQYDLLASSLRENLDMDLVYGLLKSQGK